MRFTTLQCCVPVARQHDRHLLCTLSSPANAHIFCFRMSAGTSRALLELFCVRLLELLPKTQTPNMDLQTAKLLYDKVCHVFEVRRSSTSPQDAIAVMTMLHVGQTD